MLFAMQTRISNLENQVQQLNTVTMSTNKVLNNFMDSLIPLEKRLTDIEDVNAVQTQSLKDIYAGKLNKTYASYTEVKDAFDNAFNVDAILGNQLLGLESFTKAPVKMQSFLEQFLKTEGQLDITKVGELQDTTTVPVDPWAGITKGAGDFLGAFAGGAITGFGGTALLILGGGLLLILLTGRNK